MQVRMDACVEGQGTESMSDSRLTEDLTMKSWPMSLDTSVCEAHVIRT